MREFSVNKSWKKIGIFCVQGFTGAYKKVVLAF
jgi:hypothetical protein